MPPKLRINHELKPLKLLKLPNNLLMIWISNVIIRFLYSVNRPVNGVKQERLTFVMRDGYKLKVDMFVPLAKKSNSSILYFPGGGFMMSGTHIHKRSLSSIAKELGQVAFLVHYRLAPKYPFPIALYDAYDSLVYLRKHAHNFFIHRDKIGIGGDSAGGNLCAAMSLYLQDQKQPYPLYQMLLYPALDDGKESESRKKYTATPMLRTSMLVFIYKVLFKNGYQNLEKYAYPCLHPHIEKQPPTYIEILEFDPLHDDGIKYQEILLKTNTEVVLKDISGAVHGYDAMFQTDIVQKSLNARIEFIRKHS
ncbi:MAG: alpha/beta hydrolase [Candidatus Izemoplasmatales bacterium]|jgi:acetyl esterase|nr:alpha/beta hydrolase [Candidatus Izemoplasmatales bacterium]